MPIDKNLSPGGKKTVFAHRELFDTYSPNSGSDLFSIERHFVSFGATRLMEDPACYRTKLATVTFLV
jgi:hypothetical protein